MKNKIKRIIFDIDGTLIPWDNSYLAAVKRAHAEYNISGTYEEVDSVWKIFEDHNSCYSYENFQKSLKEHLNIEVPIEFVETWFKYLGDMATPIPDIIKTLNYLSKKYSITALTNGIKESQVKRLEVAQLKEYLEDVYDAKKYMKPDPRSFIDACGPYKPEECLMVGDDYKADIKGALNAGLEVIYLTNKEPVEGITCIKKIKELKDIL